jgi:hypothetical protein
MNTLSRADTAQFFPQPYDYTALQRHWSTLIRSDRKHSLTAAHHLLYLALLGRDWRKAFTPVSNPRKLANGGLWNWGLFRATGQVDRLASGSELLIPFDGLVTPAMLRHVRARLPVELWRFASKPEAFAAGTFPFDAYRLPSGETPAHA